MARASSTSISTSRFTSSLASQGAALVRKLKQTDGLTWAVLAAIVLYVAVASPANTPTIFRNSLFRIVVFAFVVVVFLVEGPVIGTMFALAMLLPIVYSSMGAAQEGFEDHTEMVDEELDDVQAGEVDEATLEKKIDKEPEQNVQEIETYAQTKETDTDVDPEDPEDPENSTADVQASLPEMFSFSA